MASAFVMVNILQVEPWCGVCSVAADAAGVGVVGAIAVGSLTAWLAGADVDVACATSPMLDVSGLTASGSGS